MNRENLPRHHGCVVCCAGGTCHLPDAKWHGSAGGYTNHGCRCQPCTDAWAEYHYQRQASLRYLRKLHEQGLTTRGTPRKRRYVARPGSAPAPGQRPRRAIQP